MEPERDRQTTVVFDGDCAVCNAFTGWVDARDDRGRLRFVASQDSRLGGMAPGVSEADTAKALVVVTDDGREFRGARAMFETMRGLRGPWHLVGVVGSWPPLSFMAEPFYRLLARHRHRFARFVPRQDGDLDS